MTNKTELLPCPFCKCTEVKTEVEDGFHFQQCAKCGTTGPIQSRDGSADWPSWNTRAAPPEDVRAVVDEPVARIIKQGPRFRGVCEFEQARTYAEYSKKSVEESNGYWLEGEPLYRHPQRPMVLPERHGYPTNPYMCGWNACLDEIERLNKCS